MVGSERDAFAHMVTRYASWLAVHESLGVALCWTVSRTDADASSIMDLISLEWAREGVVGLAQFEESSYEDESGREHVGWLVSTGEHVGLLEVNGFGGSREPGLKAWAETVPVLAGMYWNVNLHNQLAIARDGQFAAAELWAEGQFTDESPAIARYQSSFSPETDLRAFGLAVVERETGLRLDDDLLTRNWPLVRFAARGAARERGIAGGDLDEVFYAALAAAPDSKLVEAKGLSADYAARSTGLDEEPVVQQVVAAIRAGLQPAEDSKLMRDLAVLRMRLDQEVQASPHRPGDLDDPALRRLQASTVLEWMPRVQRHYDDAEDDLDVVEHLQKVWEHVVCAMGESWPALRHQLLDLIG